MPDFLDRLLARAYGEEPVVTPVRRTRFERGPDAIAAWPAADAAEPVLPRDGPDDPGAADGPADNSDVDDLEAAGTRRRPAPVPLAPRAPAAARADFRAPRPAIAVDALMPKPATPGRDADRREPEPVPHDAVARVETPTPRRGARPATADPDTARGLAPDRAAAPELPAARRPVRPELPVETGPSATGQGDGPGRLTPAAVVQVRIGRVEVRAAAPSSPPSGPPAPSRTPSRPQPAAAAAAAGLSLDAYLERARRRS